MKLCFKIVLVILVFNFNNVFSKNINLVRDAEIESFMKDLAKPIIDLVDLDASLVKFYLENQNYLVHNNLSKFQKQLPSEIFVRVHRSFLINKNKISKIESDLIYVGSKYYKIGGSYLKSIKEKIING